MLHSWPSPGCLTSSSPSQDYFTSPIMSENPSSSDDVKAVPIRPHQYQNGFYMAPQHQQEPFPYHSPPPRKTRKVSLPDHPMRQAELEEVGLVQSYHEYHEQQQYLMDTGREDFPPLNNGTALSRSFSTSLPNIASGSEFPSSPSLSSSSPMRYPVDTRRYSLPVRSAPCVASAPCILPSQMTTPDCPHNQMTASYQAGNGCCQQGGERGRKRSVEELLQVDDTPISDANSVDSLFASSSPSPNTSPLGSSAATMSSSSNSVSVIQPVEQPPTFLSTLLERQAQLRKESQTTEEFDSERILRQSKQMRNKLRSILGRLKKTM